MIKKNPRNITSCYAGSFLRIAFYSSKAFELQNKELVKEIENIFIFYSFLFGELKNNFYLCVELINNY